MCEAHATTWFSTQGLDKVVEIYSGSMPGDPYGDAFFKVVMSKLLRRIKEVFSSEGLDEGLVWDSTPNFKASEGQATEFPSTPVLLLTTVRSRCSRLPSR